MDGSGNLSPVFSVSTYKGMLWFPTKLDKTNYLKAIEILDSQWDYTDKPGSTSFDAGQIESEANIGNDVLNAIDAYLGFSSMQHYYDSLENQNSNNWKELIPYYLEDPDARTLISSQGDMRIGNDFYHHVNDKIIAIIHNADEQKLQEVKEKGQLTPGSNVEFYDDYYGEPIPRVHSETNNPPDFPPCVFSIDVSAEKDAADFRKVTVTVLSFCSCTNPTTSTSCAAFSTKVDWGDGFTDEIPVLKTNITHTYDVREGDEKTFDIKVTVKTLGLCGGCVATTSTETVKVKIKKPEEPCFGINHTSRNDLEFTHNGQKYQLLTEFFQRGHPSSFSDAKLKVTTKLRKLVGNEWKKITAGKLKTGFEAGSIFTSNCLTETVIPLSTKEKTDDTVSVTWEPNEDFGTRKSGPKEPLCFGSIAVWSHNGLQLWK